MDEHLTLEALRVEWEALNTRLARWGWWRELVRPRGQTRGCRLFLACRQEVEQGGWSQAAEWWLAWLRDPGSLAFISDPEEREHDRCAALALLGCAGAALAHGAWPSPTLPPEVLKPLTTETKFPLGLLLDLAQALLGGAPRPARAACTLPLLAVDRAQEAREQESEGAEEQRGGGVEKRAPPHPSIPAPLPRTLSLTLEWVARPAAGNPEIYPHPDLLFVPRDRLFDEALANARQAVKSLGLEPLPEEADVRWSLSPLGGGSLPALTGPSAGAAFALGLAWLAAQGADAGASELVARLRALDLSGVSLTAAVDPQGRLSPVGGLWEKLLAAARQAAALGLLRTVVVSLEQQGVPPELERPDAAPLRVLRAADLRQAVDLLYRQHGPRFAVREHERQECGQLQLLDKSVPLQDLYQVLPLLREVKRERLPREEAQEQEEEGRHGLRPMDILRWEEALRREEVSYQRVSLEEVFDRFPQVVEGAKTAIPRFVVLGPPGSGKSTLVQYLALQAVNDKLMVSGRPLLPARVRLREWEAWAVKPVDPERSLPEFLAEQHKDLRPAPGAEDWRTWLWQGDVLLLLDGLDELRGDSSFQGALKAALEAFPACPTVLTCRTVSWEQHRGLCPDFPVFTLAGLDRAQRDAYIRAYPADHPDRFDRQALSAQLDRAPAMHPLAANPLLLSIICYVVDDPQGVTLPATRGELYDQAVQKLLTRPPRVEVSYPGGVDLPLARKRHMVERAALTLFAGLDRRRQLLFSEEDVLDALTRAAKAEGYGEAPAPWADALLQDLTQNSGILRGSPDGGYFFLHLTLQEFLAACALARAVKRGPGWEGAVEAAGREVSVAHLVDRKAWDPAWQEVIILLAGRLQDPTPLLTLLADEKKDDLFRHRLALAGRCLPEIPSAIRHPQSAIRNPKSLTSSPPPPSLSGGGTACAVP